MDMVCLSRPSYPFKFFKGCRRSVLLNGWVFVYKLSGCGFESRYYHLNLWYACFEQGVPCRFTLKRVRDLITYRHFRESHFPLFSLTCNLKVVTSGFYPSTFVYSRFSSKIQFLYCLLSSVTPCGGPMIDTERKIV